jgi:FemAB-related protein (PEP-CTERM system-associated)
MIVDAELSRMNVVRETFHQASTTGKASPLGVVDVQVVDSLDSADWDAYLERRGASPLYFRTGWEQVFAVYRLANFRLAAIRDGRIVGVLPLVFQRSLVFGRHLVSLPWFDSCGVLADDFQAREALVEAAKALAISHSARTVQLRLSEQIDGWHNFRTDKVQMRLRLEEDAGVLEKRLRSKVRNQIRNAQKRGLTVETGDQSLLGDFFRIYSTNMRDLGSPSHSRAFFRAVLQAFPDESRIHVVRMGDEVLGAGLTIANGEVLEIPWASSLRRYNSYCVNHALYWHILKQACSGGFRWFHFGRATKGSGPYRFKKQWGAEEQQLYWYYLDSDGEAPHEIRPPQETFRLATKIWQRLPLWLTRVLGPQIVAKVP